MKLAEALKERSDLNRDIEQLRARIKNNVLVQEGENTPEDPEGLKEKLDGAIERLSWLMARINLTNAVVKLDNMSLTEVIANKDALSLKIQVYKDIVDTAGHIVSRARGSEIKIRPTITVSSWQKEIDTMSKKLRQLDNRLQESNWKTDLLE